MNFLCRFVFSLVLAMPSSSAVAQINTELLDVCIEEAAQKDDAVEAFGISRGAVAEILAEITSVTGAFLRDVQPIECPSIGSAYAWNRVSAMRGQAADRYIVYDPAWLRAVVGERRLEASVIFAHEIGHFVNGHFEYGDDFTRKSIEIEADYFSGCALARLEDGNDGWAALSLVYSRLRIKTDNIYPDRFESLEAVREDYEACWVDASDRLALLDSPGGEPLTPSQNRYLEALIDWLRTAGVDENLRRAYIAMLTSALLDNRPPAVAQLTELVSLFQNEFGLEVSGELDSETTSFIRDGINDGLFSLQKRASDAEMVELRGCFEPEILEILSTVTNLKELRIRSATLCYDASYYFALGELKQIENLSLRGTTGDVGGIMEFIGQLVRLEVLNLRDTSVTSISHLSKLQKLRELDLELTQVTDLAPLRSVRKLEELSLHGTRVSDISPLRVLRNLERLEISWAPVADVKPLVGLPDLSWIEA